MKDTAFIFILICFCLVAICNIGLDRRLKKSHLDLEKSNKYIEELQKQINQISIYRANLADDNKELRRRYNNLKDSIRRGIDPSKLVN